ncbi:MAG: class I SAM-dependent methyltransferase [Bacteroidota bacterium]
MAVQKDLDAHYTVMDKIFRYSIGEMGAYSGARYDGDYTIPLEQAQHRKHEFIREHLNIKKGSKVLDMGCGWGAFLKYIDEIGAVGHGVVLAKGQAEACIKNGLNVKFMNAKHVTAETFGTTFDAISAMGSPEHLCSVEEYKAGKQDEVYRTYFKQLSEIMPVGGRLYFQTMVFGKNMMPIEEIPFDNVDVYKKEHTDAEHMAMLCDVFPGSWIPYGSEQVIETAKPYFELKSIDSGRLDYIETINQWTKAFLKWQFKKYLLFASLTPKWLFNKHFRHWLRRFRVAPNRVTFEREILEHYRMVFERVQ